MTQINSSIRSISVVNAIAQLSDHELCKMMRVSRDRAFTDEFMNRVGDFIQKSAVALCHKIQFDLNLDYRSLEGEALSEAYLAAYEAIHKYDGVSSSLKTFIGFKIKTRFLDLKRKNSIHSSRETAVETLADNAKDRYSNAEHDYEFIYKDESEKRYLTEQFQKDVVTAATLAKGYAGSDIRKKCLEALEKHTKRGLVLPLNMQQSNSIAPRPTSTLF